MAIKSGFFNSVNGDRKYNANSFAEYFATFIGNGVFPNPSNNLQIVANNDMTITIKAGKVWINGYILINDDDYVLNIEPADGVLSRVDRVVARYDTVDREIRLEVKQGNYASSPEPPVLQRDADAYELALADVLVNNGTTQITQANITDLRLNTELCGIVHGTVDQVDTTTLFNQYQTWLDEKKTEYDEGLINYANTKQGEFEGWVDNKEQDYNTYVSNKQGEWDNWYYSTTTEFEEDFNAWFDTIKDLLDENVAGNLISEIEKFGLKLLSNRKEIIDIKLKLSEEKVISFLNKTGVGFYDLFEYLDYVDTNLTTASVNVAEKEVVFNGDKLLKMKEQQFDNFNNLELAIYDKDRETINATESSTNNQIEVLITPGGINVGDKYVYNNEIYTVAVVRQ